MEDLNYGLMWVILAISLIVSEIFDKPVVTLELIGIGIILALLQINQTIKDKK